MSTRPSRTEAQQEASRRNSRRSTGPKSVAGKARSAANALRHGLRAREPRFLVLPEEDVNRYIILQARLLAEWVPVGVMEEWLVGEIGATMWRIGRCHVLEAGVISDQLAKARDVTWLALLGAADRPVDPPEVDFVSAIAGTVEGELLRRLDDHDDRLTARLLGFVRELERLQAARRAAVPASFAPAETFART